MALIKVQSEGINLADDFTFTGTIAGAGGGKVLQVVNAIDETSRTTTSTSYVTASNTLSVTITPSSASNKIFVLASFLAVGTVNSYFTIFRDATNLGNATYGMTKANQDNQESVSIHYLDSPATTSARTYQVYAKQDSGTTYINGSGARGSITAFEIAG